MRQAMLLFFLVGCGSSPSSLQDDYDETPQDVAVFNVRMDQVQKERLIVTADLLGIESDVSIRRSLSDEFGYYPTDEIFKVGFRNDLAIEREVVRIEGEVERLLQLDLDVYRNFEFQRVISYPEDYSSYYMARFIEKNRKSLDSRIRRMRTAINSSIMDR